MKTPVKTPVYPRGGGQTNFPSVTQVKFAKGKNAGLPRTSGKSRRRTGDQLLQTAMRDAKAWATRIASPSYDRK